MRTLLSCPHLSVITDGADAELNRIRDALEDVVGLRDRTDLEALLSQLAAYDLPSTRKTLDLIGHSSASQSLLELGAWTIDGDDPRVIRFFRGLAGNDVFRRLGIHAIRLLGCETATTKAGRTTIRTLAAATQLEVYGTRTMIGAQQYERSGFSDAYAHVLVSSSDIRQESAPVTRHGHADLWARLLDVEMLPAVPLTAVAPVAWPRVVASPDHARELLGLIRRSDGAVMPGLLASPLCELALPAASGRFWRGDVLLDGAFVRVYPTERPEGICYATTDPAAIRALIARISAPDTS